MPPKKGITFGKIGTGPLGSSLGQLSLQPTQISDSDSAGFGKFGQGSKTSAAVAAKNRANDPDELVPESTGELEAAMGIRGFGKVAKSFDIEALVQESKKTAMERAALSAQTQQKKQAESESTDRSDDYEVVGPAPAPPPPPPQPQVRQHSEESLWNQKTDSSTPKSEL